MIYSYLLDGKGGGVPVSREDRGGIPGADFKYAFFIVCIMVVVTVVLQYWLFKWKNWL